MTLEFRKTIQTTKGSAKEVGQRIELHKAAADTRISDEQYLKILRASHVIQSELQDAVWQPIIEQLAALEDAEPEIAIDAEVEAEEEIKP